MPIAAVIGGVIAPPTCPSPTQNKRVVCRSLSLNFLINSTQNGRTPGLV